MSPPGRGGRGGGRSGGGGGRSGGGSGRSGGGGSGRSGGGSASGRSGAAGRSALGRGGRAGGSPAVVRRPASPAGPPTRLSPPKGVGGEQVEGRQAVRELLAAGRRRVREIWLAADLDPADIVDDIVELAAHLRVPVERVARRRLEAEARSEAPQGVLAKAAPLPEAELDDLLVPRPGRPLPFLVALDGVTDPGNLGAILRTADCAGVSGIVLPRHRAVHVTPTVAKSAAGAIEHLPIALVGGMPAAIGRMRDAGVWTIGLDGEATQSLFELDGLDDVPVALVLGAEGRGLARLTKQRCDAVVSLPLLGRLASLNVSAAAAVACYEITRRRERRAR